MNKDVIEAKLKETRVARMATVDARGRPHVVPVCFIYDGQAFYTALDLKPKRVAAKRLARARHIKDKPDVALLIDEYQEDWKGLWYILIRGVAMLVSSSNGEEHTAACRLLRGKYPQYAAALLPDDAPLIRIIPKHIVSWSSVEATEPKTITGLA